MVVTGEFSSTLTIIYHIWTFSIQIQQRSFILFIHHPFPTFNPHSHGLGHFRQRFLSCRLKKIYPSHYRIKFSRDAWEKIEGRINRGRDRDRERMKIDRYIFFVSWYIASKNSTFPENLTISNWWKLRYTNGKIKFRYQIKNLCSSIAKFCNLPKCTKFEFASHHKINRVLVCQLSLSGTFLQI